MNKSILIAAIVLVGCGSSEQSTPSTRSALSSVTFIPPCARSAMVREGHIDFWAGDITSSPIASAVLNSQAIGQLASLGMPAGVWFQFEPSSMCPPVVWQYASGVIK